MEKEIRNKSSNMEEKKQSLAVMGLVAVDAHLTAVDAHLTAGFLARWFQSQGLRWGLSSLRPPPPAASSARLQALHPSVSGASLLLLLLPVGT